MLGNSYYDNENICLKLKEKDQLESLLEQSLDWHVNKLAVINYLHHLLYDYLLPGHFRDKNLNSAKVIARKVLNDI